MANLTLAIDDEVLKRARIRAIEEGTSVNAFVRRQLEEYASAKEARIEAMREILESSSRSKMRLGGRRWTREELHDRARSR